MDMMKNMGNRVANNDDKSCSSSMSKRPPNRLQLRRLALVHVLLLVTTTSSSSRSNKGPFMVADAAAWVGGTTRKTTASFFSGKTKSSAISTTPSAITLQQQSASRCRSTSTWQLGVITDPDRSEELGESPDYFLQTEDFAGDSHAPATATKTRFGNKIPQLKLPPRFAPDVGWEHHHHATVQFVHGMRQNNNLNNKVEVDNNGETIRIESLSKQQQQQHQSTTPTTTKRHVSSEEESWEHVVMDDNDIDDTETKPDVNSRDDNDQEQDDDGISLLLKQKQQQQPAIVEKEVPAPAADVETKKQQQSNNNNNNPVLSLWERMRNRPKLISESSQWKRLGKHAEYMKTRHLRELLQDEDRCNSMYATTEDGVYLDYSRQFVTSDTMKFLYELAEKQNLQEQIKQMMRGDKINFTEKRAVLHTALRAGRDEIGTIILKDDNDNNGMDVVQEVHDVLDQIKAFTEGVRSGKFRGYTGKRLRNIVSVGIGGSYLGPEFLHECLKTEPEGVTSALGYSLRFLSNVDPVDVERTCADLDPEETLVVVVSKTFTTAETMLNARTMRQWLWDFMGNDKEVVRKHMVACASLSSVDLVSDFGIDTETRFFKFWDFVGGRYSVCSAAGAVPISLLYGYDLFEKFLKGANSIDKHFATAPLDKNIPVLMGLLGIWNMSFMNYRSRTTLPYAEALLKLPAHIQQLDMESNGKCMTKHGLEVDYLVGEIDFGEAGTNGQHSFYQLLHMGQTVPCEFIGFVQSQHDFCVEGEDLSSHDELMANFFAQPDALANGKTEEEVRAEGVAEDLIPHRVFKGNRPSLSLLLPKLTAYACGQLLAIYEHRTAVQGFMWDINSFDQWGVELGKKLAIDVKAHMLEGRRRNSSNASTLTTEGGEQPLPVVETGSPATTRLLNYYLDNSKDSVCNNQESHNSMTRVTRNTHREHNNNSLPPPLQHDLGQHGSRLS